MRKHFSFAVVLCLPAFALAQPQLPKRDPVRYGVILTETLAEIYPQIDPKITLDSAVKVLEAKRYELFAAHYLDPEYFDAKVIDRAKTLEEGIEKEFLAKREDQKRNPSIVTADNRLPYEPKPFQEKIRLEAMKRAFGLSVKDMTDHMADSPETPRLFRKFWRSGDLVEAGMTASFTHKDHPGFTIYMKRVGDRWLLENRQTEEVKPMPPMPVAPTDK
jgi:outer membrane receptor for Fe3+-dicitrate